MHQTSDIADTISDELAYRDVSTDYWSNLKHIRTAAEVFVRACDNRILSTNLIRYNGTGTSYG